MSVDKLVDSTQLDADLTSVANAIRTKGGTSASLAFPAGFVSAIDAIPSGGGDPNENLIKLAKDTLTSVDIDVSNVKVKERLFNSAKALIHARIRNMGANSGQYIFYQCSNMETLILSGSGFVPSNTTRDCSKLVAIDITGMGLKQGSAFYNSTLLSNLIIRDDTVAELGNNNVFTGTPFASGGTGGTLYVPSSLVSQYTQASNWSTILGYANNQIKSIESTHTDPNAPIDLTLYYADGTPISA